jgi:AcrR family transcriptional regulator
VVLREAEIVFAERGYDGARLDDVAARVGIRRASLVHYFKDKRELYDAVLESLFGDLLAGYSRVLAGSGSMSEKLEQFIDVWVEFAHRRPEFVRILMREMADGLGEGARRLAERALPVITAVGDAILAGRATESFLPINPFHFMMTTAGASAFLLLGGAILAPGADPAFAMDVSPELHRQLQLKLMRRLLGTQGPRSVSTTKKTISREDTTR